MSVVGMSFFNSLVVDDDVAVGENPKYNNFNGFEISLLHTHEQVIVIININLIHKGFHFILILCLMDKFIKL